jgi:hypothetical protein
MAKRPTDQEMKARALGRWNNEGGAQPKAHPRRPRDPDELGKRTVDISDGETEHVATPEEERKDASGGPRRESGAT